MRRSEVAPMPLHIPNILSNLFRRPSPGRGVRTFAAAMLIPAALLGYWTTGRIATPISAPEVDGRPGLEPPPIDVLGALCLEKLLFEDVVTSKQDGLRSVAGAWSVRGDAAVGVDWTGVRAAEIDAAARSVRLVLPPPKVFSPRIDHEQTSTYKVTRGWFASAECEAEQRAAALRTAAARVAEYARRRCELPETRVRIANRLRRLLAAAGWRADVEWSDRVN